MRRPRCPAKLDRRQKLRQTRKVLRLGEPAPMCLGCLCASVEALVGLPFRDLPEWMQRKVIERDHPAGRAVQPDWTVPLCRNCHCLATDRRTDLPAEVQRPRTERERQVARLYGVADALRIAEEGLRSARAVVEAFLLDVQDHTGDES